ncbi:MAG: hypothetical protein GY861_18525 [bacterium]|nr:hypothetical protein [bacterium]
MKDKRTKEQIIADIFTYFDDYDFIQKVNDITYHQKVKLFKDTQFTNKDGQAKND